MLPPGPDAPVVGTGRRRDETTDSRPDQGDVARPERPPDADVRWEYRPARAGRILAGRRTRTRDSGGAQGVRRESMMASQRSRAGLFALVAAAGLAPIASAQPAISPTFTKDIAPIFQDKCEACHRPDSIAPMSLRTLRRGAAVGAVDQDPRRERGRCRRGTSTRPIGIQEFKNDRSLTDEQIDTIVKWVDAGAPKGDPKDMPAARRRGRANRAGTTPSDFGQTEPDLIVQSMPWTQKAGRERHLVEARRRNRPHRAALGARDRNASGHRQGPQDHASRQRRPALQIDPDAIRTPHGERPAGSWSGPSASRAR